MSPENFCERKFERENAETLSRVPRLPLPEDYQQLLTQAVLPLKQPPTSQTYLLRSILTD